MTVDDLVKTMNAHERRMLIELREVLSDATLKLWGQSADGKPTPWRPCRIVSLDPAAMMLRVASAYGATDSTNTTTDIPLTFVRRCWSSDGEWHVSIEGTAFESDGGFRKRLGFTPPGGVRF